MKNQVEFLLEIPMFSGVNKDVVNQISQSALEKIYIDNEVIFEENTAGEDLYIICSGKVQIIKNYHKQNEKLLSILTEGEIFGETCLFTKSLRSATAVAKGNTVLLSIPSEVFINIFKSFPEEGIKIINWMLFNTISRLEQTSKELATIYNISQIMMESVSKMLDVKEFLFKIATEIENILPQFCELIVYIYNIFNEEYELVTYKSEYKKWIKEVYDVNDEIVKMFNTSQEVIIENDRIYIYHLQNTGMILIIMNSQFNLSQQNKNLLNSIANLVSVSATTLKNLQEQKEKLKLESARTKYIF